ncbi:MAG: hypothetical protein QXX08_03410 [Candidatus Bathyarchaeia archaeon]
MGKDVGKRYLSGVIWDVYLYILTSNEPVGVRDVWRGLQLSSPSLAQYHVNHLLEMKLVSQTSDGRYVAEEKNRIEVLRNFVLLRGRLISRMIFYGAFIFGLLFVYVFLGPIQWSFRDFLVLTVCVFCLAVFSYEAYSQHRGIKTGVQKV